MCLTSLSPVPWGTARFIAETPEGRRGAGWRRLRVLLRLRGDLAARHACGSLARDLSDTLWTASAHWHPDLIALGRPPDDHHGGGCPQGNQPCPLVA